MDMYEQQRELKRQWRAAAIERRKRTSADQRREAGRLLAEHALEASLTAIDRRGLRLDGQ